MLAGRLALDFANAALHLPNRRWQRFVQFLVQAGVVNREKASQLLSLERSEPQTIHAIILKILRLRESIRAIFLSIVYRKPFPAFWAEPINDVLRITEGHDELISTDHSWKLQFVARDDSLEWLLAAIARSAADLLVEGPNAPIRLCANPACRLFFYDDSRTHRRRWCSMAACGNRHKVAAFARRRSTVPNRPRDRSS